MARASLDDLAAFAAVAEHKSFTRAGAALGVSTSNLSHTLRRLEARLGARLLNRNSRGVSLTSAGEALLTTLRPALESIEAGIDDIQRTRDSVAGTLRLTATHQAYRQVVRPVLSSFSRDHPNATVEVIVDYAFRDIVAEKFDAGLRLGEKLEQDMIASKVGPDLRMAVVASPDYLARRGAAEHPEDLMKHQAINYRMIASGALYAWEFEREGRKLEVRPSGPLTFNDPDLMLECALAGLGVAYVLEHEAERHLESGRLVRMLAEWTPPFPGFHIYYPSRRQMRPILAAFVTAVRRGGSEYRTPQVSAGGTGASAATAPK